MRVADLLDRAAVQLHDEGFTDWTPTELLEYLNEGIRFALGVRPDLFTVSKALQLVPGARQALPLRDIRLIRIHGTSPFRLVDMDAFQPAWRSGADGPLEQVAYEPDTPDVFWTYPPQPDPAASVQADVVSDPTPVGPADELPIDQVAEQPLVDFMLYRSYSKDAEFAGQDGRAALHYQVAKEGLTGGRDQGSGG